MRRLLLFLLLFIAFERLAHLATGGFQVSKIYTSAPTWYAPPQNLDALLDQPFTYLGSGHEAYAFLSADKKYVLKLFKHQIIRLAFIRTALAALPHHTFFEGLALARHKRLERTLSSTRIAYAHLRKETGLIALSCKTGKTVTLIDKLGIRHAIDLDKTAFIIQHKATLAPQKLGELLDQGRVDEAQACARAILDHFKRRIDLGIYDRDARVLDNFGFIGNQAIEIDTGSYAIDPTLADPAARTRALQADAHLFTSWLQHAHPALLQDENWEVANY